MSTPEVVITRITQNLPFKRIEKDAREIYSAALDDIGEKLVQDIAAAIPEDTGAGRDSVEFKTTMRSFGGGVRVFSRLMQAAIAETGRRAGAGMAPWKRGSGLFNWVVRKGFGAASLLKTRRPTVRFVKRTRVRGGDLRTRAQSLVALQEGIAYRIARKQAINGVPARHAFTRPLQANRDFIYSRLDGATAQLVARQNGRG